VCSHPARLPQPQGATANPYLTTGRNRLSYWHRGGYFFFIAFMSFTMAVAAFAAYFTTLSINKTNASISPMASPSSEGLAAIYAPCFCSYITTACAAK